MDRKIINSAVPADRAEVLSDSVEFGGDYEDRVWRTNKLRKLKIIAQDIREMEAILKADNDAADIRRASGQSSTACDDQFLVANDAADAARGRDEEKILC